MEFEEALKVELESIEGLSGRVYPLNAKQGKKPPFIVYISSEGLKDKTLSGYLDQKEVSGELNVIHQKYGDLKPLIKAVVSKLISFQGRAIAGTGPYIKNVTYESPGEMYENELDAFRSVIEFKVKF